MQRKVRSEAEMAAFAQKVARQLRSGDTLLLKGDLGAGKTFFTRALVNALCKDPQDVPSPTFTLVQSYDLPVFTLWHFDLYRLEERTEDILELGWDEARRDGVIVVEWPERLGTLTPKDRMEIAFSFDPAEEATRFIDIRLFGNAASSFSEKYL